MRIEFHILCDWFSNAFYLIEFSWKQMKNRQTNEEAEVITVALLGFGVRLFLVK